MTMNAPSASGSGRAMIDVLAADEIGEGELKLVRAAHARLALLRLGGDIRAVSAICTHARIFLAPGRLNDAGLIECPMHGALFSPQDGSVRCGPATEPIAVHEVTVIDGRVFVDPGAAPEPESAASTKPGARPSAAQWGSWR